MRLMHPKPRCNYFYQRWVGGDEIMGGEREGVVYVLFSVQRAPFHVAAAVCFKMCVPVYVFLVQQMVIQPPALQFLAPRPHVAPSPLQKALVGALQNSRR